MTPRRRGPSPGLLALDEEVALAGQLRRLIAIEEELARRHGARVHPLPDGSVVVSLPEQERATDQAARAARCALAMRSALPDVAFVVSTGQGRFSAWSAVGEVIDNGMRLLRGTPPGSIRLDDVAAGMLGARFEVRRDGTAPYLRAERDSIGVERQLLGKATSFVGRGREMSMLTNLYAGTVAESAATPVLVIGSAGVGKSRLRQELVEWVQRQPDRAELLFGGVDSVGAGSPFAMLARAIRRTAGIVDGEPLEARQEKLAARVARHVDREARDRVTEFLGEIADVRFAEERGASEALRTARANPQLMGDGMRRAFEDWLMAECAAHPVLLVLEDLHWGDLGTVSFLDSALRNLHDQPFMVLALARPEVEERFPEIWTARHRQTIRLGPLSPRASEQLVRQALGGDRRRSAGAAGGARRRQRVLSRGADPRDGGRPRRRAPRFGAGHGAGSPRRRRARRQARAAGGGHLRRAVHPRRPGRAAGRGGRHRRRLGRAGTAGGARAGGARIDARARGRRRAGVCPRPHPGSGVRDAHRRGSAARPPAGGRLARAGGSRGRHRAGGALPPGGRGVTRRPLVRTGGRAVVERE